jgi:hypothetical protein
MADKISYTKEDFCVVFDRAVNLHIIEVKQDADKPMPLTLQDSTYTRYDFAKTAIENFCRSQKKV